MKKIFFAFLYFTFSSTSTFSQKQTNNWYFGALAGIDFNSGLPVVLQGGQTATNEGSAVMSDTSGNLLFYTDGSSVWNKQNQQMPNGFGLTGGLQSSTQAALIVPDPGSDSLYYAFTVDEFGGPNGFNYSKIDMSLDSGRGDVTVKNSFLLSNAIEKITGTFHANNHDVWVMVHVFGTDAFYSYLITDSGISNPVITNIGTIHQNNVDQNSVGQMKFNPCGNKLAVAIGYQNVVDLFDFDNISGIVSNPLSIPFADHVYGAEFSPDNSKLYISCYDPASTLQQFDLNATNIPASALSLSSTSDIYGLQLAPDGKIYVVKAQNQFLGVINFPNLQGLSCNYLDMGFDTDPNFTGAHPGLGLPTFIQSYFHPDFPNIQCNVPVANFQSSDTTLCEKNCIDFTDMSSGIVTGWQWLFPGANPSLDTNQNPVNICYNAYGTFDVSLIVSNNAGMDTLFLPGFITVLQAPATPNVSVYGDTLIASAAFSYQWYLSGNPIPGATQQIFIASQTGSYSVSIADSNGCRSSSGLVTISSVLETADHNCFLINTTFNENSVVVIMNGCGADVVRYSIYTVLGQVIYSESNKPSGSGIIKNILPVALKPGLYIILVTSEDVTKSIKLTVY